MEIEVVMPMAGLGSRFSTAYRTAKPLIPVHKKPLFLWSIFSLQEVWGICRFTFICYKNDHLPSLMKPFLEKIKINYQIVEIDTRTGGPALTVLEAKPFIYPNLPLLTLDCDLFFRSHLFTKELTHLAPKTGQICYFNSNLDRFSYILTDEDEKIIQIKEKSVISNKAVIGAYCFSNAAEVFNQIQTIKPNLNTELNMSDIISNLLKSNHIFYARKNDHYFSLGTPEEIANLENNKNFQIFSDKLDQELSNS